MKWKAIGESAIGAAHITSGKPCEDAICYAAVPDTNGDEALICVVSDGAGSAMYGGWAADLVTGKTLEALTDSVTNGKPVNEGTIYMLVEDLFAELAAEADAKQVPLNEFSCTLLGCCITWDRAVFFQVGDGAIIRNDGSGFFIPVWWPMNGEYQNSTTFLVDDPTFANLNIQILEEQVKEVALFSDGLQLLALSLEHNNVHQPFFADLFKFLRIANDEEKVSVLKRKLGEYLNSKQINDRTDDDKTLFLATRKTT